MQDIKELTLQELEGILKDWGQASFHAKQIFSWIYKKQAKDFDVMSDVPINLRRRLKENFYLASLKLTGVFKSRDGTKKFLFELKDKNLIEAVTIPAEKRLTGCISTQVGCKFACRFCASGLSGFKRNLTCGEVLDEVLYLKNDSLNKRLTHLVFMGIGEPLDNYDSVIKAIRIINSKFGLNIGSRRITISTCGLIPQIERLSKENLQIELSISLHAPDDKTRSFLMPINKKYPLKDLIQACREYIEKTGRQITFEYVLIKGINLDLQKAKNLITILKDLKLRKVNLIPVNPINPVRDRIPKAPALPSVRISNGVKELKVEPPNKLEILLFKDYLLKRGLNVTLRKPRGEDIEAACGQLRLRYEK